MDKLTKMYENETEMLNADIERKKKKSHFSNAKRIKIFVIINKNIFFHK